MAFTPPSSPVTNQIYSAASGQNWIWNGTQWEPFIPPLGIAPATSGSFNAGSAAVPATSGPVISAVTPSLKTVNGVVLYGTGDVALPGSGGDVVSGSTVLTAYSSGAQSIATTAYGQSVTLPDATTMRLGACAFTINNTGGFPLKIYDNTNNILGFAYTGQAVTIGLSGNTTSAGVWVLNGAELLAITATIIGASSAGNVFTSIRRTVIDSSRTLIILSYTPPVYGIIYDSSTNTFGALTTLSSFSQQTGIAYAINSSTVLLLSNRGGSNADIQGSILTISGTTITQGSIITYTSATIIASELFQLIAVGSTYIVSYYVSSSNKILPVTVSGGVVNFGTETSLSGTTTSLTGATYLYALSSTVLMAVSYSTSLRLYCTGYTVSAGTLSVGSTSSVSVSNIDSIKVRPMGSQLAVIYTGISAGAVDVTLFSDSGAGVITASTQTAVASISIGNFGTQTDALVSGNKLIIASYTTANIVTNTSGTASAGTMITIGNVSGNSYTRSLYWTAVSASNNLALFVGANGATPTTNTRVSRLVIDYSGASPSVSSAEDAIITAGTLSGYYAPLTYYGDRTGAWFYGSLNFNAQLPVTGANMGVYSNGALYAYTPKNMCVLSSTNLNITGSFTAGATISGANNEIWSYTAPYLIRYESIT